LENGDIVTACSDGTARIWTTHANRFCSDEELAAYTDLISQYTLSRSASPVSYTYFLKVL
jgi:phospholipase A-2-activating protein